METVLDRLIQAASRGRVDEGDAVALAVQVAGAASPDALPAASAYDRYSGSE